MKKSKYISMILIIIVIVVYYLFYYTDFKMVYRFNEEYCDNNIKIAVLDSGCSAIDSNYVKIINLNESDDGIDKLGHGSEIIGIISCLTKHAQIYSLKVLDDAGNGNRKKILKALDWCIKNKIDIINLSFSMQKDDKEIKEKLERIDLIGAIVICSYDNDNKISYPAQYEFVFGVKSHNKYLRRKEVFVQNRSLVAFGGDKRELGSYNSFATARVTAFFSQNMKIKDSVRRILHEE